MVYLDKETFSDWHPRFDMAHTSLQNCSESRWLYFKPDFTSNTLTYIVRKRVDGYGRVKTVEYEFTDLESALECYNY